MGQRNISMKIQRNNQNLNYSSNELRRPSEVRDSFLNRRNSVFNKNDASSNAYKGRDTANTSIISP
jgi:hypothetical protein